MRKNKVRLYTVQVPPVSREFAQELQRAFPVRNIHHKMTEAEIREYGGQQQVVDWVMKYSVARVTQGTL